MLPDDLNPNKRKSPRTSISPPPTKRKLHTGTTKNAVANFFTPTSRKPKDCTTWLERAPDDDAPTSLLVAKYEPEHKPDGSAAGELGVKRTKVAAFDMDATLITTISGKKFGTEATDWKWWDPSVPPKLRGLYDDGYQVVIFSNQAGLALHPDPKAKGPKAKTDRVVQFKLKCSAVLSGLDIPTTLYAATGKDIFRKPRPGMWREFVEDCGLDSVDLEHSIFVGDAGGRTSVVVGGSKAGKAAAKDFSCSDRNFAQNVGLPYLTPEEFFLGEPPRDFVREFDLEQYPHTQQDGSQVLFEKNADKDMVIFCGPPGAGKSTFYWKHLEPLGYERINQDILKTRDRCVSEASKQLDKGESVAIDNTNADADTRAVWVKLAQKHNVPIRCIWFKTPLSIAQHNAAVRSMNVAVNPEKRSALPGLAFGGFNSRFREPNTSEGFVDVVEIDFLFSGTKEEYAVWGKYWL